MFFRAQTTPVRDRDLHILPLLSHLDVLVMSKQCLNNKRRKTPKLLGLATLGEKRIIMKVTQHSKISQKL